MDEFHFFNPPEYPLDMKRMKMNQKCMKKVILKVINTPIYTNQQCFQSQVDGHSRGLEKCVGVCRGDSGGEIFDNFEVILKAHLLPL